MAVEDHVALSCHEDIRSVPFHFKVSCFSVTVGKKEDSGRTKLPPGLAQVNPFASDFMIVW